MNWREQLDKAVGAVKGIADSEQLKGITAKARDTASMLASKVKEGALGTAEAFVEANADPSAIRVHYLNANFSIVSPSEGIEISRPHAGTIVVSDAAGNGLLINASAEKTSVAEMIGTVKQLSENAYDLGVEDGVNVVVFKD
jgi:hypothetical protein